MTLTPPRFHIADDMPMSLGKAIAAAIAPKVDPIEAFNKGVHWPKGWTTASLDNGGFDQEKTFFENLDEAKPLESPPSVQKFRVGDRVRSNDAHHTLHNLWQRMTILAMPVGDFVKLAEDTRPGYEAGFYAENLELISPASETEGEGWVAWNGGSTPPCSVGEVKLRDGDVRSAAAICTWEHGSGICGHEYEVVAYRVVKPS